MAEPVVIDRRYRGPPASANGGYTCGILAAGLEARTAEVNLRAPPPLETELALELSDAGATLRDGDRTIADGRSLDGFEIDLPAPPSLAVALEADRNFPYYDDHAFPGCFVCGPDRDEGDGLCIYPGPVGDGSVLTTVWTPAPAFAAADGPVRDEIVWAALDCPSGNAAHHEDPGEGAMVLARLRGHLDAPVAVAHPHVVVGWAIQRDGRKHRSGTVIFDESGTPAAWAEGLWIELRDEAD